ncbi:PREDICTED: uncharacterized protein LOC109188264 isoform X3 [Ipomoea nil]|uniref:uncharacterized protein LOC109188264 isoform X3 n=1 Tax=Ipomoea nil TaxID=35883 RepID=UPI000900A2B4|nr:PREDICTED: uncharacterized protein LOC109188264 isoform X3 [Ipomoea nil]
MRGTKRLAASDTNLFSSDSNQIKRVVGGSPFDAQQAQTSDQLSVTAPQLDMQRAGSSRQHVRALNTQFASWVQTQLQNHPDELWEDGVQDYLSHASSIMEKFRDVVNWLKANATKGHGITSLEFQTTQKTVGSENKENNVKLSMEKSVFPMASSSSSFVSSWNSGPLFNNKAPFSFGLQTSIPQIQTALPLNNDTSNDADADAEDDVKQPGSPSVKKTEEKGIFVVHEVKCKLYVKSTDPTEKDAWKDRGTGQLSIKCKEGVSKGTRESKPTVLIRNDVGKVLLNALLYPGIKTNMQKNSIVTIFHIADGENNDNVVARTCLIRLKSMEDRDKLAEVIEDYAPAA